MPLDWKHLNAGAIAFSETNLATAKAAGVGGGLDPMAHRTAASLAFCTKALIDHINGLERRLAEVEQSHVFGGAHEAGCLYERGAAVTHDGGLWTATRVTQQLPGAGDGWRRVPEGGRVAS